MDNHFTIVVTIKEVTHDDPPPRRIVNEKPVTSGRVVRDVINVNTSDATKEMAIQRVIRILETEL